MITASEGFHARKEKKVNNVSFGDPSYASPLEKGAQQYRQWRLCRASSCRRTNGLPGLKRPERSRSRLFYQCIPSFLGCSQRGWPTTLSSPNTRSAARPAGSTRSRARHGAGGDVTTQASALRARRQRCDQCYRSCAHARIPEPGRHRHIVV